MPEEDRKIWPPGKFKAWLYQLPRLMWLLTAYDEPMTSVEGVERKINKHVAWNPSKLHFSRTLHMIRAAATSYFICGGRIECG